MDAKQFIDALINIMNMDEMEKWLIIGFSRSSKEIHIYDRARLMELARQLGQTVITEPYANKNYPVESSFTYNGWRFFSIYSMEDFK